MVENYPDLKANQNFLALQAQLEGTENRIAVARRDYIEAVRVYNTSLQDLPVDDLGDASWFTGNEPFQNFTASEEQDAAAEGRFQLMEQGRPARAEPCSPPVERKRAHDPSAPVGG